MAGSVTCAPSDAGGSITKYTIAWTSDAAGAVSGNVVSLKRGEIIEARFRPGTAGDQPTDLYDLTLLDADSIDVLSGAGANLSNATPTTAVPVVSTYFRRFLQGGNYTPTVAAAGNAKKGTLELLVFG